MVIDSSTAFDAAAAGGVKARQWLAGIATLAARHQVAVLLAAPLERSAAARAMQAIARMVWVLEPDPLDPHRRLMLPGANRLAAVQAGQQRPGPAAGRRAGAVGSKPLAVAGGDGPQRLEAAGSAALVPTAAMDWLSQRLEAGAVGLPVIKAELKEAGFSWATIRRASDEMGVLRRAAGRRGGVCVETACHAVRHQRLAGRCRRRRGGMPENAGGRMGGFFEEAHEGEGVAEETAGTDPAGTCATCATSGIEQETEDSAPEPAGQPAQPEQPGWARLASRLSGLLPMLLLCLLPMLIAGERVHRVRGIVDQREQPAQLEQPDSPNLSPTSVTRGGDGVISNARLVHLGHGIGADASFPRAPSQPPPEIPREERMWEGPLNLRDLCKVRDGRDLSDVLCTCAGSSGLASVTPGAGYAAWSAANVDRRGKGSSSGGWHVHRVPCPTSRGHVGRYGRRAAKVPLDDSDMPTQAWDMAPESCLLVVEMPPA